MFPPLARGFVGCYYEQPCYKILTALEAQPNTASGCSRNRGCSLTRRLGVWTLVPRNIKLCGDLLSQDCGPVPAVEDESEIRHCQWVGLPYRSQDRQSRPRPRLVKTHRLRPSFDHSSQRRFARYLGSCSSWCSDAVKDFGAYIVLYR